MTDLVLKGALSTGRERGALVGRLMELMINFREQEEIEELVPDVLARVLSSPLEDSAWQWLVLTGRLEKEPESWPFG